MGGVTVLGNFSVDHVDSRPPSPGGCPVFAVMALRALHADGKVVARASPEDRWLFEELLGGDLISALPAETTSAFGLRYAGGQRTLAVDAIGDPWTVEDVEAAAIETEWVHVAPLLRSDFPLPALVSITAAGHRVSYDGQGLVRLPRVGPLRLDDQFDRALLREIAVLKLNGEEAEALAGGEFTPAAASRLGVPEILVTFGAEGCDLYADGQRTHVPARPVTGVHTTGTGDVFMVSYLTDRAAGSSPIAAATRASAIVADILEERLAEEGSP